MPRTIATFNEEVQKNCAWALLLHFTNADGTDFDLTPFASFTGKVRVGPANDATTLATMTITVTNAVGGLAVAALAAKDTASLPATGNSFDQKTPVWAEIDGFLTGDQYNPICMARGNLQVTPGGNAVQTQGSAPTVPLSQVNLIVGAASAAAARALIGINDGGGLVPVAQLPLATSLAAGAMPATQMAKTSAVTLAQMQDLGTGKLQTIAGGGWADSMMLQAEGLGVALAAGFGSFRPGYCPGGAMPNDAAFTDAGVHGGRTNVYPGTNNTTLVNLSGVTYVQSGSPHPVFAFGFHGIVPTPRTSELVRFGLITSGNVVGVTLESYANFDATHLVLQAGNTGGAQLAVSTHVPDGVTPHSYLVVIDGTNAKLLIDGSVVATAALTDLAAGSYLLRAVCYRTDGAKLQMREFGYGY